MNDKRGHTRQFATIAAALLALSSLAVSPLVVPAFAAKASGD